MKRGYRGGVTLVATAGLITMALGQAPAPGHGSGWTGITDPEEVIEARRGLMVESERLMKPIDSFTTGEPIDAAQLQSAALTISRMLLALPHLFPPPTNLYDPAVPEPPTSALPAVWQDFATFFKLAEAAEAAATEMASTTGEEPLRQAGRNLRASCDACHAIYLQPYAPPKVTQEDLEFDFDSVLPRD
jgi:cytochrome c556